MNNSLVLPSVGRQDSGEYICTATNNMGTTEVTIMLDVESECFCLLPFYLFVLGKMMNDPKLDLVEINCVLCTTYFFKSFRETLEKSLKLN